MTDPGSRPVLREGDYLTVAQVLRILPVGRTMLYALIAERTIPAIRIASVSSRRGRVLVLRRGLEEYLARLRVPQAPPIREPVAVDVDTLRARILARKK
ncbi:MAG: helix-turn-helix domain-containing protein [Planctomycetes bacterium]|nr:helix-turn-helix domain-containing protein [Planctomycetota bacterium]